MLSTKKVLTFPSHSNYMNTSTTDLCLWGSSAIATKAAILFDTNLAISPLSSEKPYANSRNYSNYISQPPHHQAPLGIWVGALTWRENCPLIRHKEGISTSWKWMLLGWKSIWCCLKSSLRISQPLLWKTHMLWRRKMLYLPLLSISAPLN